MKKGLSLILALMMALTAISVPVFAEEVFTLEDLANAFENAPDGEEVEITLGGDIDLSAPTEVSTYEELLAALEEENANVILLNDITATAAQHSGYGVAGIVLEPGDVLDGGNYTLTINGANNTWDCVIAMTGGTVKNLTIAGAMRGVFMPGASGDVVISDCVFEDVIYTFNSDDGSKDYKVTIIDSEMNGWTSFSNVHQSVTFNNCTFAEGSGYAFCRPYQDGTTFNNCDFAEGYELDASVEKNEPIAFNNCTLADEPLTAENIADMCGTGVTVVIDGEEVAVIEKILPEAEVSALAPITLTQELDGYHIYNGSVVEGTEDMPLEVVMNFKATQTAEEASQTGYGDYITDFAITISGLPEGEGFNGDNCYLAGNYGSFGWVVIPLDGNEIKNGTYPVLGLVDAKFTYVDICKEVQDFIAAIHIDEAVLAEYPELNVGLALEITNPENADEKIQIGETYTYDAEELKTGKIPAAEVTVLDATTLTDYDVWDGKKLTAGTEELPLEIVMNFKANDTKEEAASGVYSDWVTDFYVTFDGLENGSFVADDCYLAGNYGSYGWITIPMDGFTVENGKEYRIVEAYDDNLTYYDICDYVKDFTAAIHVDEAILAANPNLTVSLALKMFNPERPSQIIQAGETATYDVSDLWPAEKSVSVGDEYFETIEEAIQAAFMAPDTEEAVVTLHKDITITQPIKIENKVATYALRANVEGEDAVAKDVVIDGQGTTLTYTGSDRAISVESSANGANLTIKDLTVDCVAPYCQRGINYNTCGEVTLENVTVTGNNITYALNLPGSSDGAQVSIKNSSFSGNIALNIWGEYTSIVAWDSHFISVDNTSSEDYAAIAINNDGVTMANGSAVTINGGSVIALNEKGEPSIALSNGCLYAAHEFSETTEVVGKVIEIVAIIEYGDSFYSFTDLQEAFDVAAKDNKPVKLIRDIELTDTTLTVAKGTTVTLDLNGFRIRAKENATGNYQFIANYGTLTITDSSEGKGGSIEVSANVNRNWNHYSAVIANLGGTLTIEAGCINHRGGTDMAYAIDNNSTSGNANLTVNDGDVLSTYRAIRQFANSTKAENNLTINGGYVKSGTNNHSVWLQSSNIKANKGTTTINGGTVGTVYVWAPAGADASALEVAIDATKVEGVKDGLPVGYEIENANGFYGIVTVPVVTLGTGNVTVKNVDGTCTLVLAAYTDDTAAQLTAVAYVTVENGTYTFAQDTDAVTFADGAYVKAMLWDQETLAPLCTADAK